MPRPAQTDLKRYLAKTFDAALIEPEAILAQNIEVYPSGWFDLDYSILGIGGFPKGRLVELYGPETAGKSLIALRVVAEAQAANKKCQVVWFDTEQVLNDQRGLTWAKLHGVDVSRLYCVDEIYAEDVLRAVRDCCERGADIVVVDSLAQLIPKAEWEEREKTFIGLLARVLGKEIKPIVKAARQGNTLVMFVNQVRENPGQLFGDSQRTPGGRALKHLASIRLEVAKRQDIYDHDRIIGNEVALNLLKSKVSPRGRRTGRDAEEIKLYYDGHRDDQLPLMIRAAARFGLCKRSGTWYTYERVKGQGLDGMALALREAEANKEFEKRTKQAMLAAVDTASEITETPWDEAIDEAADL